MRENGDNLDFVIVKIIECFQDAGLDQIYIDDKIEYFKSYSKYGRFHVLYEALRMLDDKNMVRQADKLGVTYNELNSTLKVMNAL